MITFFLACEPQEWAASSSSAQQEVQAAATVSDVALGCTFVVQTLHGDTTAGNTMSYEFAQIGSTVVRGTDAVLARLSMSADDEACENVSVWYMKLVVYGSDMNDTGWVYGSLLPSRVHVRDRRDGSDVATTYETYASEGGSWIRVIFEGDAWHLPAGQTLEFDITGNVNKAATGDTVTVSVDEDSASWATSGEVVWQEYHAVETATTLTITDS